MVIDVAVRVLVDVRVVQPDLLVFDACKGVPDLTFARAQGLDLSAVEDRPASNVSMMW